MDILYVLQQVLSLRYTFPKKKIMVPTEMVFWKGSEVLHFHKGEEISLEK